MMPYNTYLIEARIDINCYPLKEPEAAADQEFTIGDLHGNTLTLCYFLIKHNILELSLADYQTIICLLAKDPEQLNAEDIAYFERLIAQAPVNPCKRVRLIGDEVCDRAGNDYFTLVIIDRLVSAGIELEILLSNHAIELIGLYEKGLLLFPNVNKDNYPYQTGFPASYHLDTSLQKLGVLLRNQLISKEKITYLMQVYLSTLKVFAYTTTDNTLDLFSHAPVGFETIAAFANHYQLYYGDAQLKELTLTLDGINYLLHQKLAEKVLYEEFARASLVNPHIALTDDAQQNPWTRAAWHRISKPSADKGFYSGYQNLALFATINNYDIRYIHGHDGNGEVPEDYVDYVINLDGLLGKTPESHQGLYRILVHSFPPSLSHTHQEEVLPNEPAASTEPKTPTRSL